MCIDTVIVKLPLAWFAGDVLGFSCAPLSSSSVLLFERLRKECTQPCNRSCKSSLKCYEKKYSQCKYYNIKEDERRFQKRNDFQLIFFYSTLNANQLLVMKPLHPHRNFEQRLRLSMFASLQRLSTLSHFFQAGNSYFEEMCEGQQLLFPLCSNFPSNGTLHMLLLTFSLFPFHLTRGSRIFHTEGPPLPFWVWCTYDFCGNG